MENIAWKKEKITRDAVVLLNEALKDQPGVNLYIYGHSADELRSYDTDIRVYREDTFFSPRYSLMHYGARCENRDGTAIFEVAKRVRKYTQNPDEYHNGGQGAGSIRCPARKSDGRIYTILSERL